MATWLRGLTVRRKVLLVAAAGMMTLMFEVLVAHVAGNPHVRVVQMVPIVYSALAFVALAMCALLPGPRPVLDRLTIAVGAVGIAVGVAGSYFHGRSLLESLSGETLTARHVMHALGLAPPLFAPGAFIGVGLLLVTLHRIIQDQ